MKDTNVQKQKSQGVVPEKQYSYHEIIEFLDAHWQTNKDDTSLSCIKALNKAFNNVANSLNTILIAGTNGKSLTAHYAIKLFQEEGMNIGTFFSPHLLTYNERISLNNETIQNKHFTDYANEVINKAAQLGLEPNSRDILTMTALLFFQKNNADVVLLEVNQDGACDPATICAPRVAAITRITDQEITGWADSIEQAIKNMMGIAKPGTHVISADQSKLNLQIMQQIAEQQESIWAMPIRKLAPLNYPFEQLHGRCAALAERIVHIYMNNCIEDDKDKYEKTSLMIKRKGQRGRPTLEAKRQSELNPKKTVEQFWKEIEPSLPGRFQIFDKEKPTVLVDTASNIDALSNLLLGVRLLHYQRPLKGLAIVLGCNNANMNSAELVKQLRYFFKKTSGQLFLCPVDPVPGTFDTQAWDIEKLANELKALKVKVRTTKSLQEAYDLAAASVDDRHGLVAITGSPSMVAEYWRIKGLKKLL